MAIMRLELGELVPLMKLFLATMRGFNLPQGSIIILSSATQLATASIQEYLVEATEAARLLHNTYGGDVELLLGPPFLLDNYNIPSLIRGVFEMHAWATRAQGFTPSLSISWACAVENIKEKGTGGMQETAVQVLKLRTCLRPSSQTSLWVSNGWPDMPKGVAAMTTSMEEKLVDVMFLELKEKFGIHLSEANVDRALRERRQPPGPRKKSLVIVGASNAERLATELADNGHTIFQVKTTSWVVTAETVEVLESHVSRAVNKNKPDAVIFMMLDSTLYMGRTTDGTTMRAKRGADGVYHIKGELILATKDIQLNIFTAIKPVLMAAGCKPLILVTPLPRYSLGPCCKDSNHIMNQRKEDFHRNMLRDLDGAAENFRRFIFNDNIRRGSTFNPSLLYRDWQVAELWDDPVHPSSMVFKKMSGEIERCLDRLETKRKADLDREAPANMGNEWRQRDSQWRPDQRGRGRGGWRPSRGWSRRGHGRGYGRGDRD